MDRFFAFPQVYTHYSIYQKSHPLLLKVMQLHAESRPISAAGSTASVVLELAFCLTL